MSRKEFFLISIGIFLTVVAWLLADIYHASAQEYTKDSVTIPVVSQTAISHGIINTLKKRDY